MLALKLFQKAFPSLLILAVVTGLFGYGYHAGRKYERAIFEARLSDQRNWYEARITLTDQSHRTALQLATARARWAEQQHVAAMAEIDRQHTEAMNNARTEADSIIAGLRAGERRLRERFTCPAGTDTGAGSGAGQAGPAAGVGDAAAQGGLSAEDADFLVRLAAEADQVALQLSACQAIVAGDRIPKNTPQRQ